jgi:hypothetical protein
MQPWNEAKSKQFTVLRPVFCVAAVLLAWLAYGGRAEASCGYYVVTANPSGEMIANQQRALPMRHEAPADCPCRGPQCHAGQENGGAAPAPAPTAGADPLAITFTGEILQVNACGLACAADAQLPCAPLLLPLDPPPKA